MHLPKLWSGTGKQQGCGWTPGLIPQGSMTLGLNVQAVGVRTRYWRWGQRGLGGVARLLGNGTFACKSQTPLASLSSFLLFFYLSSPLAGPTHKPEGKETFNLLGRLEKGGGVRRVSPMAQVLILAISLRRGHLDPLSYG